MLMAESKKDLVSIGIPVWNQSRFTDQCLASLFSTTMGYDLEVIIVDNGSTDDTPAILAKYPSVKVIRNRRNRGVVAAWNQVVNASTGEWIGILNNDLVFAPLWLTKLLRSAQQYKAKVIFPAFTAKTLPPRFPNNPKLTRGFSQGRSLTGFCFLVHRSVFEKIGVFDEQFQMGWYEDRDFEMRLKNAGIVYGMVMDSYVHHFESKTLVTVPGIRKYMNENRVKFLKKHPKPTIPY